MKKVYILLIVLFALLTGCASTSTVLGLNEYEIQANGNYLLFFASGCDVANERYNKEAFNLCPAGYDEIGKRYEDIGGRDNPGWCYYRGKIRCRDAAVSEVLK